MIRLQKNIVLSVLAGLSVAVSGASALAQIGTAFTYQGELQDGGVKVSGQFDMQFRLYDAVSGGAQVGPTQCVPGVTVTGGRFSLPLDFATAFASPRYLQIDVRPSAGQACSDQTGFTTLVPRQTITPAPSATFATTAGNALTAATAANATSFNGMSPAFFQNAANLTSGTIPESRLPATIPQVAANNAFTGANTFSGANVFSNANTFSGSNNFSGSSNTFAGTLNTAGTIVHTGTADGTILNCGTTTIPSGLTQEVGRQVLNLDMNFRGPTRNTTLKGAGVRVDMRGGQAPIQFLTRAAGSSTDLTPMQIEEDNNVTISNQLAVGSVKFPDNTVQATAAPKIMAGMISSNVTVTVGSGVTVSRPNSTPGLYRITFNTAWPSSVSYITTVTVNGSSSRHLPTLTQTRFYVDVLWSDEAGGTGAALDTSFNYTIVAVP